MEKLSDSQFNIKNTKEHPDLYHKSIKGGYWVLFLRVVTNLLSFVKVFIIANFFYLEDLGIISIALMMMEVLSTFTETGFNAALIQKKDDIQSYLNTAWTAGLIKGFILFLALFFAAPFLASIRVSADKVDLTISILRVMGICFLIRGIQNIGIVYFKKELQFRKVFILNLASTLTDIVLSLGFIFFFRSIWGVIAARIISEAVSCAGGYFLSSYRPRFCFEYAKARELWKFGKWIYGQSILGYFLEIGDNFFTWFCLGLPQLALYKYAKDFANMPATHISHVISTVSFPAYSKIQDDIPRLRMAYLKILKITAFFAFPVSFLIFIIGPDFVRLFLKSDLHPMTIPLQILTLKGLLACTGATRGPLYIAMGKPHVTWHLQWIRLIILAILIYPLTRMWGIAGTAISVVIVSLTIKPFGFMIVHKMLKCSLLEHLAPSVCPIIASCVMCIGIVALKSLYPDDGYVLFFVHASVGMFIYLVSLFLLDYYLKYGILDIVIEQIYLIRKKIGL